MEIHPIPRDPLRFDAFALLARFGRERRVSLRDPKTLEELLVQVREKVSETVDNPIFLFGQRTESMFEGLIASLGHFQLLRREDVGEFYVSDTGLRVPDFQVVLDDGARLLIEVKNHHPKRNPLKDFALRGGYLDGLRSYAALLDCPLAIAIYWSQLNLWTLVPEARFRKVKSRDIVDFTTAMGSNIMAILGDLTIGTQAPLLARIWANEDQPRSIDDNGEVDFIIANVEIFSQDRLITDKMEQSIALNLMFFGKWLEHSSVLLDEGGELQGVEFRFQPEESTGLGFEIVGSLSEMFSKYFIFETSETDGVYQTQAHISPGSFGQLVPAGYKGDVLKLWRFTLQPWKDKE